VGDQVTLVAWKPDDTEWRPAPDIVLYPRLGPEERQEIDEHAEGPPALIIEVTSASTFAYDVSMEGARRRRRQAGKAYGYLVGLGILVYMVFDPQGEFTDGQCRAWRRAGDVVQEWHPESDGCYNSSATDVSLWPEEALPRVIDPQGNPAPYWFEVARENATLRRENTAQAQ
jgi:Uma2 family endonuclease